jgi:hypothetical protein
MYTREIGVPFHGMITITVLARAEEVAAGAVSVNDRIVDTVHAGVRGRIQ